MMCDTLSCHGLYSWWPYQMEAFSALLAICAENSPVPGEFRAQRPVTRLFDIFFDLRLNKRLSKQSWGWWFETLSRSLWRHCNVVPHIKRIRQKGMKSRCGLHKNFKRPLRSWALTFYMKRYTPQAFHMMRILKSLWWSVGRNMVRSFESQPATQTDGQADRRANSHAKTYIELLTTVKMQFNAQYTDTYFHTFPYFAVFIIKRRRTNSWTQIITHIPLQITCMHIKHTYYISFHQLQHDISWKENKIVKEHNEKLVSIIIITAVTP